MAQRNHQFTQAGARVVGISVDSPERNAAMVEKLKLPFPLLSDPDGERAIKPYGVWHEGADIARPAVVLVTPTGSEAFRQVGADFADRVPEDELVKAVEHLGLGPTEQARPSVGEARPGPNAFPAKYLRPYYLGSKFAAKALAGRVPEAQGDAEQLQQEYDRFLDAAGWLDERS